MTQPTDPTRDAPPIGLAAFHSLALRRLLTPIIKESVYTLLAERGELWTFDAKGAKRGKPHPSAALCTEQAFDTALAEFLERVPGARGALADFGDVRRAQAREQARIDQATANRLDSKARR